MKLVGLIELKVHLVESKFEPMESSSLIELNFRPVKLIPRLNQRVVELIDSTLWLMECIEALVELGV